MLDFLIVYISAAFVLFAAFALNSKRECKKVNAMLSRDCYSVDYKSCFIYALLFPLTAAFMLCDLIKNAMK